MATTSKIGVHGVDTTMYFVKDLDRATKFYSDMFGFAPTLSAPGIVSEWTFPGGETFGVLKSSMVPWSPGLGVHFGVADIKEAVAACKRSGVALPTGGEIIETQVCYLTPAMDTEGNQFLIHQLKDRG